MIASPYPVEGWRGVKRELTHRTRGAFLARQQARDTGAGEVFASAWGIEKPGTYLLPWPKADVEACQLLREWRGPTEPNPAWRIAA